jgi:hypothetical protein
MEEEPPILDEDPVIAEEVRRGLKQLRENIRKYLKRRLPRFKAHMNMLLTDRGESSYEHVAN